MKTSAKMKEKSLTLRLFIIVTIAIMIRSTDGDDQTKSERKIYRDANREPSGVPEKESFLETLYKSLPDIPTLGKNIGASLSSLIHNSLINNPSKNKGNLIFLPPDKSPSKYPTLVYGYHPISSNPSNYPVESTFPPPLSALWHPSPIPNANPPTPPSPPPSPPPPSLTYPPSPSSQSPAHQPLPPIPSSTHPPPPPPSPSHPSSPPPPSSFVIHSQSSPLSPSSPLSYASPPPSPPPSEFHPISHSPPTLVYRPPPSPTPSPTSGGTYTPKGSPPPSELNPPISPYLPPSSPLQPLHQLPPSPEADQIPPDSPHTPSSESTKHPFKPTASFPLSTGGCPAFSGFLEEGQKEPIGYQTCGIRICRKYGGEFHLEVQTCNVVVYNPNYTCVVIANLTNPFPECCPQFWCDD